MPDDGPASSRVRAFGAGLPATAGHPGRSFRFLAAAGVTIEVMATSEIRTSCAVAESDGIKALEAVHAGFQLGGSECHQAQGTESTLEA